MDEYINKKALRDALYDADAITMEGVKILNQFPSADVAPARHGRWIGYHEADIGYDEYGARCSNCNFEVEDHEVDFVMNYCPNCGAKMDGDHDG